MGAMTTITTLSTIDPGLSVIFVAFIGPLLTYIVAARKLSGRIRDSDATELWAESRSIREWSAERVKELADHSEQVEARLGEMESANSTLLTENRKLIREVFGLHETIRELREQMRSLTDLLEHERAKVTRLMQEAEDSPRRRHNDPPISEGHEEGSDERYT